MNAVVFSASQPFAVVAHFIWQTCGKNRCAIVTASHSILIVFRITPLDHDLFATTVFFSPSLFLCSLVSRLPVHRCIFFTHSAFFSISFCLLFILVYQSRNNISRWMRDSGKSNYSGAVFIEKLPPPIIIG